jgi:hypothetical protein
MTTITRLYAAEDKAVAAATALKSEFGKDAVNLVTRSSGKNAAAIAAAIVKGGVKSAAAATFAEKVAKGNSLVTVEADWGFGSKATAILNKHDPIDGADESSEEATAISSNDAAPFSALLGWPVLQKFKSTVKLSDDPTPYSKFARWQPVLQKFNSNVKLIDDPTPLSARLGWLPLLQNSKGFSTLSPDQKGKAYLIKNPAPFSEFLNLSVLSK